MPDTVPEIINTETETVPLARIREHPANPRRGDVEAVCESIRANGFFGALVVQRSSGHVLAGNHRLKAARVLGMDAVPVVYVDVDDERAMRILLADNRTSDLGTYDDAALADLLEHLDTTGGGLSGSGYDADGLREVLYDLGRDAPDFAPLMAPEARLDQTNVSTCPHCGEPIT